ncbi:GABA transporter 1-like [Zingiber officinale]|uniref:GABA transporter 1-like n=1 Tax=Zingiber officinale TaxID=94328 RepID=UPI001C4CEDA7|nr:GABA transporter 1-like [Zingiber officinale]
MALNMDGNQSHAHAASQLDAGALFVLKSKGPGWGRFYIASLQFSVCFGAVIGTTLLGGQSMKSLYLVEKPGGTMKLYEFVIIFGVLMLVLAQVPSFHSLRHINLVSLLLCLAYGACATAGSIHAGNSSDVPPRDYSLPSKDVDRVFRAFDAISIMATTYGNGIIPEIQSATAEIQPTAAPLVTGKMFNGLCLCYAIMISTFFSVAISQSVILSNFVQQDGSTLVPR